MLNQLGRVKMVELLVIRAYALCKSSQLWNIIPNIATIQVLLFKSTVFVCPVRLRELTFDGKPLNSCLGLVVDDDIDIGMEPKAVIYRILFLELLTPNAEDECMACIFPGRPKEPSSLPSPAAKDIRTSGRSGWKRFWSRLSVYAVRPRVTLLPVRSRP